jgi:hypothetical protein
MLSVSICLAYLLLLSLRVSFACPVPRRSPVTALMITPLVINRRCKWVGYLQLGKNTYLGNPFKVT